MIHGNSSETCSKKNEEVKKQYTTPSLKEFGSIGGLVKSGITVGTEAADDYNAYAGRVS